MCQMHVLAAAGLPERVVLRVVRRVRDRVAGAA